MELTEALNQLKTTAIRPRTNVEYLKDSFIYKTFDNATVCLEVYENGAGQWFVVKTNAFVAWTKDAAIAFNISGNCSVFTLREMAQAVN